MNTDQKPTKLLIWNSFCLFPQKRFVNKLFRISVTWNVMH